jgi:hypothetical protein
VLEPFRVPTRSERNGDFAPLLRCWPLLELAFDAGDDRGELAVVECPDED